LISTFASVEDVGIELGKTRFRLTSPKPEGTPPVPAGEKWSEARSREERRDSEVRQRWSSSSGPSGRCGVRVDYSLSCVGLREVREGQKIAVGSGCGLWRVRSWRAEITTSIRWSTLSSGSLNPDRINMPDVRQTSVARGEACAMPSRTSTGGWDYGTRSSPRTTRRLPGGLRAHRTLPMDKS